MSTSQTGPIKWFIGLSFQGTHATCLQFVDISLPQNAASCMVRQDCSAKLSHPGWPTSHVDSRQRGGTCTHLDPLTLVNWWCGHRGPAWYHCWLRDFILKSSLLQLTSTTTTKKSRNQIWTEPFISVLEALPLRVWGRITILTAISMPGTRLFKVRTKIITKEAKQKSAAKANNSTVPCPELPKDAFPIKESNNARVASISANRTHTRYGAWCIETHFLGTLEAPQRLVIMVMGGPLWQKNDNAAFSGKFLGINRSK